MRVIAASNRDLEKAVREGQFRQDLYYRLAIIAIFIPPLRDRKEDILPLVDFFIDRYNRRFKKSIRGITDETRHLHPQPQLAGQCPRTEKHDRARHDSRRGTFSAPGVSAVFGGGIRRPHAVRADLSRRWRPQACPTDATLPRLYIPEGGTSLEEVEHSMVELAMSQANGNQTNAAKLLDISRDALRYKLKKFGLIRGDEEASQATMNEEQ